MLLGIDRDREAISAASRTLEGYKNRIILHNGNYCDIKSILKQYGIDEIDGAILDLGVSSKRIFVQS